MPQFKLPSHYQQIKTIHLAAKLGVLGDVQQLLFENSKLLHDLDYYGNTALYYACLCGHDEVVHYLLKMGAKDDSVNRSYRNALTSKVRQLLKKYLNYGSDFLTSIERMKQSKSNSYESLETAFSTLFDEVCMNGSDSWDNEDIYSGGPHASTSDIQIVVNNNCSHQIFNCHLLVLVSRWKYFRKYYLFNNSDLLSDDQLHLSIPAQLKKLRHGTITLDNVEPEVFLILLRYIYTNRFNTNIDEFINPSDTDEMDRIKNLMMDLLRCVLRFEIDELVTAVVDECHMLNVSFDTQKVMNEFRKEKGKRKEKLRKIPDSVGRSYRNSIVTSSLLTTQTYHVSNKSTSQTNSQQQPTFYYDPIDFAIQRMATKGISDIIVQSNLDPAEPIFCHTLLLARRCPYFDVLLKGPFNDLQHLPRHEDTEIPVVTIEDISHTILLQCIRYLYTENVSLSNTNAADLLAAATKLNISSLKEECEMYIFSMIDLSNCISIYSLAHSLFAENLKTKAHNFILKNIAKSTGSIKQQLVDEMTALHDEMYDDQSGDFQLFD